MSYGVTSGQLNMSTPGVTADPTSQTYSTQLNSLQPATVYFYRIKSRNEFEVLSTEVFTFTTIDSRSSEVFNLQANSPNDTTLVISWEPPANPNGDILSYSVSIINLSDGATVEESTTRTSIMEINLAPGIAYNVSIAAVNRAAGLGEFSLLIYFTRELEPNVFPKNVTVTRPSATVMVVSWIPLSYTEARGFISHYTVAYSSLTSGRKIQTVDTMTQTVLGMDTSTVKLEDLDANTDYIVQVSATNGAGKGDVSPPVLAVKGMSQGVDVAVIGIVVVLVIALLVGTALVLIIVILALKLQKYKWFLVNAQPSKANVHAYDAVRGQLQDAGRSDDVYSEIKTPRINSGGEKIALSECPAYDPVPTTAIQEHQDVGEQDTEYEVVQPTSQV